MLSMCVEFWYEVMFVVLPRFFVVMGVWQRQNVASYPCAGYGYDILVATYAV